MRLNKYVAQGTGLSRRAADKAIEDGRISVNGKLPSVGQQINTDDVVLLDNVAITPAVNRVTIILNKPVGYVCSRDGQGNKTVYDLLPQELHELKPVGRLDKNSSGLLLLTNDGQLAYELTHPKFQKMKLYKLSLNKPLSLEDKVKIEQGVMLDDGVSSLQLTVDSRQQKTVNRKLSTVNYRVAMSEGRNRQIRRTFEALGYNVVKLHRTHFGPYVLNGLPLGKYSVILAA